MDEQRHLNLIEAYLDHRLTPEDRRELEGLLIQSPAVRTLFWNCMRQHACTWELLAEAQGKNLAISESAIRSREELGLPAGAAGAPAAGALVNGGLRNKTRRVAGTIRRERGVTTGVRVFWAAAAALCLLTAGVIAWHFAPSGEPAPSVAAVQPMANLGAVGSNGGMVIREKGSAPLASGLKLFPGDLVKTAGGAAAQPGTEVRFADGTRLLLQPGTQLTFLGDEHGKALDLFAGSFAADVAAQPVGRPLTVATPHATIQVVGTQFTLTVGGSNTRLQVDEGKVRLTRSGDRQTADVAAAQFVIAGLEGELTVQAVPPPVVAVEPRREAPRHEEPRREEPRREEPAPVPHGDPLPLDELAGKVTEIAGNKTSFQLKVVRAGKAALIGSEVKFAANWVREGDRVGPKEADLRIIRDLHVGDAVRIKFIYDEHYRFVNLKVMERAPREIPRDTPRETPREAPPLKTEPEHKEMAPAMGAH